MAELGLNNFALKLYNQLGANNNVNLFISPFSISTALAMCYFGARNETAEQLRALLSFGNLTDAQILEHYGSLLNHINKSLGNEIAISSANKIYPSVEIKDEFVDLVRKNFHSSVEQMNYSDPRRAAEIINQWVAQQTRDKITNLLSPSALSSLTRMVLVNAIYFKGNWLNQFDKNATVKKDFHAIDGNVSVVDMMHLRGKKFPYFNHPNGLPASACTFPYVGHQVAMTVILPDKGHSIQEIETQLTADTLNYLFTTGMTPPTVNVQLPKFKLEYKTELSDELIKLGAYLPFDEARADLSGMGKDLFVSKVIHQAVVEVNEEGTEAAAATAVVIGLRCAVRPAPTIEFICDRPFLFIIHELVHKTTLFIGKYVKPL